MTKRIVIAMVLGGLVGACWGPGAASLSEVSRLIVQLVKIFATPLLFLSVLNAVVNNEIKSRHALRMGGISVFNAVIALTIGLVFSNVFRVGETLKGLFESAPSGSADLRFATKLDFAKVLGNFVPESILQPFVENLALSMILLALLLGFAVRRLARNDPEGSRRLKVFGKETAWWLNITETVIFWVLQIIPVGVFCAVGAAVGKTGFGVFRGLLAYVILGLGGLATHVLITHHAWLLYLRRSIPQFWREAREPVVYAIGVNSSLATLPLTLKALRRLGISEESSTLGACVGTNFNNDGIMLYEAMAAILVAQALGIHLSLGNQISIGALSAIAAMGIAGVPEAGFISLSLVLATVGLPTGALPLLLAVDWIIARGRSAVNVCSDMIVSMAIDGRAATHA